MSNKDKLSTPQNRYFEISLENYTQAEEAEFSRALESNGAKVIFTMVFGSAISPREQSETVKVDPKRWDVDVLWIMDDMSSIESVDVITTESGKSYIPTSISRVEWQERKAMGSKPKRGLHIFTYSLSELLESNDPFLSHVLKNGSLLSGAIPEVVKQKFGEIGNKVKLWQKLRYAFKGENNRVI